MAITLEGIIGTTSSEISSSSIIVTSATNALVGSFICVVVLVSIRPGGATHSPTATDSSANSYSLLFSAPNAGVGKALYVLGSQVTTQLNIAGTITVTLNSSAQARIAHAFSATGVGALDVSSYKINSIGRPTSGLTPQTAEDNSFVLALGAVYRGVRLTLASTAPWARLTAANAEKLNLTAYYQIIHTKTAVEFRSTTVATSPWYCAALVFKAGTAVPGTIARRITVNDIVNISDSFGSADPSIGDKVVSVTDSAIFTDTVPPVRGAPYAATALDELTYAERFRVTNPLITAQLRLGNSVPSEGVNLAWLDFPPLNPSENTSVISSADLIPESYNGLRNQLTDSGTGRKHANGWSLLYQYNPTPGVNYIDDGPSGYILNLQPDAVGQDPVWISKQFSKSIKIEPPDQNGIAWRIQVEDGLIIKRYILIERDNSWLRNVFNVGDELLLFYTVVESSYQHSNTAGSLLEVTTEPVLIDGKRVKLPHNDIQQLLSFTLGNRELLSSGAIDRSTTFPTADLESWNPDRGELTFFRTLSKNSKLVANYTYRNNTFSYTGYYDENTSTFRDLDICPIEGHTYDNGRPTKELIGKPIYVYLLPAAACRISMLSSTGIRTTDPDRIIYSGTRFIRSFMRWQLSKSGDLQD